jgi:hypothetical protein
MKYDAHTTVAAGEGVLLGLLRMQRTWHSVWIVAGDRTKARQTRESARTVIARLRDRRAAEAQTVPTALPVRDRLRGTRRDGLRQVA